MRWFLELWGPTLGQVRQERVGCAGIVHLERELSQSPSQLQEFLLLAGSGMFS